MNKEVNSEELYLSPEATETKVAIADESKRKPEKVSEILELRDKDKKVFRMSDGTEQAEFYPKAVHVLDEETGEYLDPDNTLKISDDGKYFRNKKGAFVAKFNREANEDELFSIEEGKHKVTVFAKKSKKSLGKTVCVSERPKAGFNGRSVATCVDSDIVGITFSGIDDASSLEYSVIGSGVKENIIISKQAPVYHYAFILGCENVTAVFDEHSKRVSFTSNETGEEVFFIPTPFMKDANSEISFGVDYEVKPLENGNVQLTVTADSEWINAEERAFPVAIDPQILVYGSQKVSSYSWHKGGMSVSETHHIGSKREVAGDSARRMYMSIAMPTIPHNPRIKKVELIIKQSAACFEDLSTSKFGLFRVTDNIITGPMVNLTTDTELIDYDRIKTDANAEYRFDITKLYDSLRSEGAVKANIVLKMLDESVVSTDDVMIYGSTHSNYGPRMIVTYESGYAVNESYRTQTHELGRFGQGSIDLACGNLMFDSQDFAWSGNRMPVTIRHLYNSALSDVQYTNGASIGLKTADFSAMKIGKGWKLNLMQSIYNVGTPADGIHFNEVIFVDENGSEIRFTKSEKTTINAETNIEYHLYESVSDGGMQYDPLKKIISIGDEKYHFDTSGRLFKISDEYNNTMSITYTADRISSVTDGAGRGFLFAYNANGQLTSITAPDETMVTYGYENELLTRITYPNDRIVKISYIGNKPSAVTLCDASDNILHKVEYVFEGDCVKSVAEYGADSEEGTTSEFSYSAAANRTVVTTTEADETESTFTKVYAFDDDGEIISEYMYTEETGNVATSGSSSGINPISDGGVASNINNLLLNHDFAELINWHPLESNNDFGYYNLSVYDYGTYEEDGSFTPQLNTKFGQYVLEANAGKDCGIDNITNGMYQEVSLPAGEYVFSGYIRVTTNFDGNETTRGAFLRVVGENGNILAESERLSCRDSEYIRLTVPFVLEEAENVRVQIMSSGCGRFFANAVQLENNPVANAYNMLKNSNFERGIEGWTTKTETENIPANATVSESVCFNMSKSLAISGDLNHAQIASQSVPVKIEKNVCETFILSGWAKANALPVRERENSEAATFRLRAEIIYAKNLDMTAGAEIENEFENDVFYADFSPCTEEWQFASVEISKSKCHNLASVEISCEYSYNSGVAYFDDIQLVRSGIETDFVGESNSDDAGTSYSSNTTESEEDVAPEFEEAKDGHGNAFTETTFADGEFGTIYRSFGFADDGNDLVKETDARGNTTEYTVDDETSRNEEIIDRLGNKTAYEYDASGRTTKVTSKNANDEALANVSYGYDAFDNLKEIVRGDGMKYALAYDAFHNLESIGIEGKSEQLVKYDYKKGSGRLKSVTYANGNVMYATYNSIGQMIGEEWKDVAEGNTIAKYKYSYDGSGNIVRSLDILSEIEYTYTYEQGRIIRATEARVSLNDNGFAVSKDIVNTIRYTYDGEGQLTKKTIVPANGETTVVHIDNADGNTIVKFSAGGHNITSHSKTDSFGRKVFDELQLGTGFVSRQFAYLAGKVTEEHKDNSKIKSSATTQLVSQIVLSDGMTLSYGYDAEERITSVVESYVVGEETVTNTILYTYDALGQLLTETVNGVVVNEMTYDNYGNILTKNGKAYTYGDPVWKDKLTSIDGQDITYDAQGNPVSYLGHALMWEKGRQLKSFDGISYTYNANGIRTSKTVGGIKHDFTLDGTKILREVWGDNTLVPMYDNEDSVCGIIYNSVPYYFLKNLQGDIISIVDKDACVIARYSYDAWGVPTIVSDTSDCNIAHINPFRYRGYYFDTEIGLYYLQSRYYNPSTGRFVNADEVEVVDALERIIFFNLYSYCINNPVNEVDESGSVLASKIAEVILGAVCGLLIQLVNDLLSYLIDWVFDNEKKTFSPVMWDYVSAAIDYALSVLNPFSKKAKAFIVILKLVPTMVKHVWRWITGTDFSLSDLIWDITWSVVGAIVDFSLNYTQKRKLTKLKNYYKKRTPEYKLKHLQLNAHFKALGRNFEIGVDIAAWIIDRVIKAIGVF